MLYASALLLSFVLLFALSVLSGVLAVRQVAPVARMGVLRLMARNSLMLGVLMVISAAWLSGCGTQPSPAAIWTQVPAGLMTPPHKPVQLTAGSASTTPGETTSSTPSSAPSTASGTGR